MEGNQGLQLTIVYRLNQTTHTFGPSHRDEVSTGPPKLKPNVDYALEEFETCPDREPHRREEMPLDTWENTLHMYGIKK